HPRLLASAAILGAIVAILDRKYLLAAACLAIAFVIHPLMASFGISYCIFVAWKQPPQASAPLLAPLFPLRWICEPTSDAWRAAGALLASALPRFRCDFRRLDRPSYFADTCFPMAVVLCSFGAAYVLRAETDSSCFPAPPVPRRAFPRSVDPRVCLDPPEHTAG